MQTQFQLLLVWKKVFGIVLFLPRENLLLGPGKKNFYPEELLENSWNFLIISQLESHSCFGGVVTCYVFARESLIWGRALENHIFYPGKLLEF